MLTRLTIPALNLFLVLLVFACLPILGCGATPTVETPGNVSAPASIQRAAGASAQSPGATAEGATAVSGTVSPAIGTTTGPATTAMEPQPTPAAPVHALNTGSGNVDQPSQEPAEPPLAVDLDSGTGPNVTVEVSLGQAVSLPTTEIVTLLAPSVVNITTEIAAIDRFNAIIPPSGVGTGIILSPDGHILTNNHVLTNAQQITVTLSDGSNHPAKVVGRDPTTDLAVVEIDGVEGLEPAQLGDSSELLVGEDVIAIGHALGLSGAPTVSKGVVSALERSIDTGTNATIVDLIQTDASINPGNSGGPLVNSRAEVIGVNTAMIRGVQGMGFAINVNDAKIVASQLIDLGFVRRGYLGVLPTAVTPRVAAQLRIDPETEGVLLRDVIPGTASAEAGLQAGDIILTMDDQRLRNIGELSKFLISHQPGDMVDVVLLRDGTEVIANITLGERPTE